MAAPCRRAGDIPGRSYLRLHLLFKPYPETLMLAALIVAMILMVIAEGFILTFISEKP